ncbi:hypothetical protein QBC35DRAFT_67157 [Podospora australis]|uniref:Hemerythrin-like domain-containing protein n=1 Tax=Podospora australis TaxID=1536484 RepID=A0AAN7AFN8_9PEZI|nr:hypothetical protein QBC35DRAFT_67157 [Podospora australis]
MPRLSEAVKRDHARITDAYHGLIETKPEDRNGDDFVWALARYLIVENLALIPALEYYINNGRQRQRRLSDDYDSINAKLRHMSKYNPSEESFNSSLKAIWLDLEPHIREETDEDLDELERLMGPEGSEALGRKYEKLKEMLQKPYGKGGVPDADTMGDVLDTTRQQLMERMGIAGVSSSP